MAHMDNSGAGVRKIYLVTILIRQSGAVLVEVSYTFTLATAIISCLDVPHICLMDTFPSRCSDYLAVVYLLRPADLRSAQMNMLS